MSSAEIRLFDVVRGRDDSITAAAICNGRQHWKTPDGRLEVWEGHDTICDNRSCQESSSEVLDISLFSIRSQEILGLSALVPQGLVLIGKRKVYSGGEAVTPKQLEIGTLLGDGEGTTFVKDKYDLGYGKRRFVYYVRNVGGKSELRKVGREDRKRTSKKLAKLRQGERKSEVSYEVTYLNERLIELYQLHRTPEVLEEIENVKELLRLASSLSVEASIEAAEGNEQIARELASSRAREIGVGLEQIRERLMLEKTVRDEAHKEIRQINE